MGDEVDECYEFHPGEDGTSAVVLVRQASVPKAMEDTTQLGYLHEGRLMRRRRSVSLRSDDGGGGDQQAGGADIAPRGCVNARTLVAHSRNPGAKCLRPADRMSCSRCTPAPSSQGGGRRPTPGGGRPPS